MHGAGRGSSSCSGEGPTGVPKVHGAPRAHRPAGHMGYTKTHSAPGCRAPPRTHGDPRMLRQPKAHEPLGHTAPKAAWLWGVCIHPGLMGTMGTWWPQARGLPMAMPGVRQPQPAQQPPSLPGCHHHVGAHPPQEEELQELPLKQDRERALSSPPPWASRRAAAGTPDRAGKEDGATPRIQAGTRRPQHIPRRWDPPIPNSSASPRP